MAHIAIDLTSILASGDNGGAKLLTIDLIRHLSKLAPQHQFTLFTLSRAHDALAILDAPNMKRICLDVAENSKARNLFSYAFKKTIQRISKKSDTIAEKIPALLDKNKYDLLFSPFPVYFSKATNTPIVSVIHDIQFRYYPQFFDTPDLKAREINFKSTCQRSQKIICISDFVRDTILENSILKPEMVKTIYINLPNRFVNKITLQSHDNFLLYPANFWQHKNHINLFSAFKIYRDQNPDSTLKLVCTGAPVARYESLTAYIHSLGLEKWITLPGYVTDNELAQLMHTCKALIFPSLYEGFGMPVVEAMAIGKPVLCSNVTSLPEIAGDAALLFDPNVPKQIAESIAQIENDENLRQDLIARGYRRSQFFADEQQMARDYLKVFEEMIATTYKSISIITPSYNQGRFIEKTIQSVLSQNVADLEHVIFDGASTDNTVEILKQYNTHINWISEKDNGQTHAINKGIHATSGEIIGWLNSDDIYYPGSIKKVLDYFSKNPDIEIVYGMANHIDENNQFINPYPVEEWNFERLLFTCFICQPAVFFRRNIFKKYGLLDESLQYCMDYEYWIRLAKAGVKFGYMNTTLAASRVHADTKTLGSRLKAHYETNSMLKKTMGKTPDRWLSNYAHAVLEKQNFIEDKSIPFCFLITIVSCYAGLKWNKKISADMLKWTVEIWGALLKATINKLPIASKIYQKMKSLRTATPIVMNSAPIITESDPIIAESKPCPIEPEPVYGSNGKPSPIINA